jgi:MSHA biogenesis protein MshQ
MNLFRRLFLLYIALLSMPVFSQMCSDIWTQAVRANSAVPVNINVPNTPNPTFPEPLQPTDYYFSDNASYVLSRNAVRTTVGATARLFINGNLNIENNVMLNAGGPAENFILVVTGSLSIGNNSQINGYILAGGAISIGNNVQIDGAVTAKGAIALSNGVSVSYNSDGLSRLEGGVLCDKSNACLADDFNQASLSNSWVAARSNGSFTPSIVNGRLRMTQAVGNQATSATLQRLYPAANNLLVVEFDYWAYGGSSADGLALVLSDASVTPQPGAFGGALGYGFKPGIPGFAGGWIGFGLDEYGNFSNEGGVGSIGRRRQSVVARGSGIGTSGYRYLRGTCNNGTTNTGGNCLSPAVDGNQNSPHRYRFTLDSRNAGNTLVSVERDSGSGFTTLIAPFNAQTQTGQAAVPENFLLSFTGSTGGATNIHELDNLSVCALRSAAIGQQIDHFEFDYSGQALTCKPETFTVRACKNASCSELITESVTASLSPENGGNVNWLGGNVISFSGGQTSVSLRRTVAGSTTVGVSGSSPSTRPLSQTLCRAGSGGLSVAACNVNFSDSGLVFSIPDGIANQSQPNIVLSAVRKDGSSQQCVPEFANVSRNVAFWSDYITPGPIGRVTSLPVSVNGINAGGAESSAVTQTLAFNAQGQANITVNYADAGQVQLNARYSGSAATNDSGLTMRGADPFIRRPLGLCIKTAGSCAAADSSCGKFAVAGQPFALNITAHRFESGSADVCVNPVTPSFSHSSIALSHSLLAPSPGIAGNLTVTSYQHQARVNSENIVQQTVSEVGVFRFSTAALSYLAMADMVPAAQSQPTGRFIPDRFSITAGTALAACGSFSYFNQPSFSTAFRLQALNGAGVITQNYKNDFARLDVSQWTDMSSAAGLRYSAPQLSAGATLMQGALAPIGNWVAGEAELVVSHYASRPNTPIEPLALNVYASPRDSDNVSIASAGLLNSNPTELRYGRLVLKNVAGPENEPLPLAFTTEYWDGARFLSNAADNCTVISNSSTLLSTQQGSPDLTLGGMGGTVQQGQFPAHNLWLNTPGSTGNWLIEYQAEPWLQYYWRGTSVNYQQNPSAEVMFGRFRGNPRQISWRELFQ